MNEPLGFSQDGDVVTLRVSLADYQHVVMALGYIAGNSSGEALVNWLAVADRLNAGNPQWTPYGSTDGNPA